MPGSVKQEGVLAQAADIPSVDRILKSAPLQSLLQQYGHTQVSRHLRAYLDVLRIQALTGQLSLSTMAAQAIADHLAKQLKADSQSRLVVVYNLTGTVLHTNLGRALLPDEAVQAVVNVLTMPANLEFNLDSGQRGDRDDLVEDLICELTGAEAATIVNNNAAAVLLMLNTLGNQREVVVSRGELVEIGGSFRIPDIMQRAGARLVEVGTTNRTHRTDYEQAITAQTAMLLKVHCSNYEVVGFTKSVELAQVVQLAHQHALPAAVDLGSGTLIDLTQWGLPPEPTVQDSIKDGADIVTFSGDKLLGGPQAGVLVGQRDLIAKIKKNPLKRALRVGKLTMAALEPVLRLYRAPEFLAQRLTTLRLLTRGSQQMQIQAQRLAPVLQRALGHDFQVSGAHMLSQIGSGAMPVNALPSYGLAIRYAAQGRPGRHLSRVQTLLRGLLRPVIGRIADDTLWLDLRCLEESDEAGFVAQLVEPLQ